MASPVNRRRGKLQVTQIGLFEDQRVHLEVLMRVTGKSKGLIIRDAIDKFFAEFRIGPNDTLHDAERRARSKTDLGDR